MARLSKQALDGNVETILLALLEDGPSYGYAIVKQLNQRASGHLKLGEGTVYPVLHRLEENGLITATWRAGDNGRQRKYYRLSPKGRRKLARNRDEWHTLVQVMQNVLQPAPGQGATA